MNGQQNKPKSMSKILQDKIAAINAEGVQEVQKSVTSQVLWSNNTSGFGSPDAPYVCDNCKDRFTFKSSYDFHINRRCLIILLSCNVCRRIVSFTNKCQMLSHVKQHIAKNKFDSYFLNIKDLVVRPLSIYQVDDIPVDNALNDMHKKFNEDTEKYLEILHRRNSLGDTNSFSQSIQNKIDSLFKGLDDKIKDSKESDNKNSTTEDKNQIDLRNIIIPILEDPLQISDGEVVDEPVTVHTNTSSSNKIVANPLVGKKIQTKTCHRLTDVHCFYCNELYTSSSKFNNQKLARQAHFQRIVSTESPFTCYICQVVLFNPCMLAAHINVHEKVKPFLCPECGLMCRNINVFWNHMLLTCYHFTRQSAVMCVAKNCMALLLPSITLSHFWNDHIQLLQQCEKCNIPLWKKHPHSKCPLDSQCQHKYTEIPRCNNCGVSAKNKDEMLQHIQNAHIFEKPTKSIFACPGCKSVFTGYLSNKKHMEQCSRFVAHFDAYKADVIKKYRVEDIASTLWEGIPTTCAFCKKKFYCNKSQLSKNVLACLECKNKALSKVENKKIYGTLVKTCNDCKKTFVYPMTNENFDGPEPCPVCLKSESFFVTNKRRYKNTISLTVAKPKTDIIKNHNSLEPEQNISTECVAEIKNSGITETSNNISVEDVTNSVDEASIESHGSVEKKCNKSKKKRRSGWTMKRKASEDVSIYSSGMVIENKRSVKEEWACAKCKFTSKDRMEFRNHVRGEHKDSTSYQCMDCGLCFVVKPSLFNHLFVAHQIKDTDKYVADNECFDAEAIKSLELGEVVSTAASTASTALKQNQCSICMEQFENSADHDKHFRVHGMAFLLKRKTNH